MSNSPAASSESARQSSLEIGVTVKGETVNQFLERLKLVLRDVVRAEIASALESLEGKLARAPTDEARLPAVRGVDLSPAEPVKARDVRMALLLGKLPDDVGLLIDVMTMAKLLNVSRRTLERLIQEKAVPPPIQLTGKYAPLAATRGTGMDRRRLPPHESLVVRAERSAQISKVIALSELG